MFKLFGNKPAAKPATIETVTLAYHRDVIDAMNEEIIKLRTERNNAQAARNAEREASIRKGRLASELLTERDAARDKNLEIAGNLVAAHNVLREIVALETPSSAHIGRKMAAKAREGLPEFAAGEREAA